jgi:hypothetical protein
MKGVYYNFNCNYSVKTNQKNLKRTIKFDLAKFVNDLLWITESGQFVISIKIINNNFSSVFAVIT